MKTEAIMRQPVSTVTNSSLVLNGTQSLGYEARQISKLPSSQHVRVRVVATGLCGSDLHYWQHGRIGPFVVNGPLVLGHESAGIVEECGLDVKSLRVGDHVALEPGVPCRTCEHCRAGVYNLCPSMRFAATPPHDGTLCRFYSLPEDFCFRLPPEISLEEGALVEPLSVAVHCVRSACITPRSSLIVLGAGPIGLLCCAVARAFGSCNVAAIDIVDSRLEFASSFASVPTYRMQQDLSPEENAERVRATLNFENGADAVIEASGAQPCIACGIHLLKRGGTLVQAGLGSSNIDFPVGELCSKEGVFKGSFRYGPGDYQLAIDLLGSGRVSVKSLITHRFVFEDAEQAFRNVAERKGLKTIILGPDIQLS